MSSSRLISDHASGGLVENKYDLDEITEAFKERARRPIEKRLKARRSLSILQAKVPEGNFGLSLAHTETKELVDFLGDWSFALNQVCFSGRLLHYLKIPKFVTDEDVYGYWSDETRTIHLNIGAHLEDPKEWHAWDADCTKSLLNTLFHEMMHAFFGVLTKRGRGLDISPLAGGLGEDGHGPPWANAMEIMQDSLNQVLPFQIGVIFPSVELSMKEYGRWATVNEMVRWGANPAAIRYWGSETEIPIRSYQTQQRATQTQISSNQSTATQTTCTQSNATQTTPFQDSRTVVQKMRATGKIIIVSFLVILSLVM